MGIKKWIDGQGIWFYATVFIVSAAFFSLLQWTDSFADPDAFYHAKMAVLIAENRSPVMTFPWLPLTSLADTFIDHHLLYHVLLVPFVTLFPPLVGIKIAAALFASIFVTFFAWFLTRVFESLPQKYLWSGLFIGILLTNHIFVSRLNIPKTGPLALLLLFGALHCIMRGRLTLLGVASFLWVWTHGSWPLVLVMTGFGWILSLFSKEAARTLKPLLSTLLGCLAGLVINPYFPTNISFYWLQTGKIAVANIASATAVGNEWYSLGLSLVPLNAVILIIFVCSLFFFLLKKKSTDDIISCALTILFLILSVRSQRYLEYFVPLTIFFAAHALLPLLARLPASINEWRAFVFSARDWSPMRVCGMIAGCYAALIISGFNIAHAVAIFRQAHYFPIAEYKGGNEWLIRNTPQGSRVYHDYWDDFPGLFFFNAHNTYISGLDPRFLAEKNPRLDRLFSDLASGTIHAPAERIIKNFKSEYVFTRKKRSTLADQLEKDKGAREVFENEWTRVFELNRRPGQAL